MVNVGREWTAARMESVLAGSPPIRNFKATFELVQPDGEVVPFELLMPEGALRTEVGREYPEEFHPLDVLLASLGRVAIRLFLYPRPTLVRDKEAILRVVR